MITKFMGLLLFLVGFVLILLAVLVLLRVVMPDLGFFERILMFIGGLILCLIGYVMARDQSAVE